MVQVHQRRLDLESTLGEEDVPEHLRTKVRAGSTLIARADGRIDCLVAKPLPLQNGELAEAPAPLREAAAQFDTAGGKRLRRLLAARGDMEAADALTPWLVAPAASRLTLSNLHAAVTLSGA